MWIDTHCHLDAAEFASDLDAVVLRARRSGVMQMVIPAVDPDSLDRVAAIAHRHGLGYCLGFHPLALDRVNAQDLDRLALAVDRATSDPHFVAVGEIGLDFFDPSAPDHTRQEAIYAAQLAISQQHGLPVILHVRRSADRLLFHARRLHRHGGIVHAFNGSEQQAQHWVAQGFCLGFGGAATYDGSLRIRRLASQLAPSGLVVETDAPDIPPAWLRTAQGVQRNDPSQLPRIAADIARLRGIDVNTLAEMTTQNALRVLPRLAGIAPTHEGVMG
jgi:TatD DNase family protein